MEKNTYKAQRRRSLFTYLENKLHYKGSVLYNIPVHYLPRLLLLLLVGIFYVGNTHYYERMVRQLSQMESETAALRVAYTALQASYMFDSKQSEIAKKVAPLGLYETPYPPLKIKPR